MPTVLTISRNFPPIGPAGSSIRLVKFIKYLSQEGWTFFVITQDPAKPAVYEKEKSNVLESEIPISVDVVRHSAKFAISDETAINSILRYITAFGWGFGVIFDGLRKIRRNHIDLLYAGIPNFVNGITTAILCKLTKIPFVLDIKDDVVGGMFYINKSALQQAFENILEKFIINTARKIVFVTQNSLEIYKKRYPGKSNDFVFIPNGCDLEEFSDNSLPALVYHSNCFLILSAASRYRRDYRDAEPFFRAVESFLSKNPKAVKSMKIVFLGCNLGEEYSQLIKSLGLSEIIETYPAVERNVYRSWLSRADLLFLVQPYNNKTSTAGTLYEYWANSKAPILLFSEEGTSRDLIEQNLLGKGFYFTDIQPAADFIQEVYSANETGNPIRISSKGIQAFDRRNLAHQMKNVWIDCLENSSKFK